MADPQASGSRGCGVEQEEPSNVLLLLHEAEIEPSHGSEDVEPASNWLHVEAELGDFQQIEKLFTSLSTTDQAKRLRLLHSVHAGELPLHCAARGGFNDILEILLPVDLPDLTNAQCQNGGWSPLHFAAANGHASTVQWLVAERKAHLTVQDQDGNTPLHLAVLLGHRDVVKYLVTHEEATNILFVLNKDGMLPISVCEDPLMFEDFYFSAVYRSGSFNRDVITTSDANKRSILHFAAQFTVLNADELASLITEMDPAQLEQKDKNGDSFLHVAAMSGNISILEALQDLGAKRTVNVTRLIMISSREDPLHSPGLLALLHNHRDFFYELLTMSKVEIPFWCITQVLKDELRDNPEIEHRLDLFASTLPTYLALYANKHCIFDFLLRTNIISPNQWDDEYKRTCLHWAVLDKRTDIIMKIAHDGRMGPGIQDREGKTALHHAFEQNNHMVMDILRARPNFKDYEEKLYRDREVYVQALNAILVGAALIVSVTFAGWLQWPSNADFNSVFMKVFWASNSISFFTAVATMCVTTAALLPTPRRYVGYIVKKLHFAIVVDAGLLALSLLAVMLAFAVVGFAAVQSSHIATYQAIMKATTGGAGFLSLTMWIAFVIQIYNCTPPKSVYVALMLPHRLSRRLLSLLRPHFMDSSRLGYRSLSRSELQALRGGDLVAYLQIPHAAPPAMHRILRQSQFDSIYSRTKKP